MKLLGKDKFELVGKLLNDTGLEVDDVLVELDNRVHDICGYERKRRYIYGTSKFLK
jgi:hypothetical protein